MKKTSPLSLSRTLLAAVLLPPAASGTTLFSDNFDGADGGLNGTTPDVSDGSSWVAAPLFGDDGSTGDTAGSATLAFTPADGQIYTVDASFSGFGLVGGADTDWFALGFVNGQSTANGASDRFITGNVVGTAWMMHRGDVTLGSNQTFLGTGQTGAGNFGLGVGGGDNTGQLYALDPTSTELDLRVLLDTTGGAGNWTATWYAKRSADPGFTEVRATENLLPGATISAVGVARSGPGVTGTLESFTLTQIPEPSSALFLGLAGLIAFRRSR